MTTEALKEKLDVDTCLPYGEQLRTFLNSSHISLGEVSDSLRRKGVFCYDSDKAFTVPILSSSLLRPSELVSLLEASISREQTPKEKTERIQLVTSSADWASSIKQIDLVSLVSSFEGCSGISFENNPELTFKDGMASVRYKIKRTDYSKDLLARELYFNGEIILSNNHGAVELTFVTTHTSKETDRINDKLVKGVANHFHKSGITKKEIPDKIKFDLFDNKQRVVFMMKLVLNFSESSEIGQILDFSLKRNESKPTLPDDPQIKWMESAIRDIKMGGQQLNHVFLLNTEKYYDYYFILRITVHYKYTFGPNTGTCQVSYFFDVGNRKSEIKQSEFMFCVDRLSSDDRIAEDALLALKRKIYAFVRKIVDKAREEVLGVVK